jgi:hypothetical protein
MRIKHINRIIVLSIITLVFSCITPFIPVTDEVKELLVVEGLITDQPGINTVKISKSLPLGKKNAATPIKGCIVTISDNVNNTYNLKETVTGTYVTDTTTFKGVIGRKYTLHIRTNSSFGNLSFESSPVEMRPVPAIDSVFYEKTLIRDADQYYPAVQGCQLYLSTHDPSNNCRFYRWEYSETWEFHLPYSVPNRICWLSSNSDRIKIKNTSALGTDKVTRYPINFISSNQTDRLDVKYSILVNQYSLNEEEFLYWEKLQTVIEQTGGLYDITPAAIESNISCLDDPKNKVLGYFSVSAQSAKRIFIQDNFLGRTNQYSLCPGDTIDGNATIPNLNVNVWVIEEYYDLGGGRHRVITYTKGCADCTTRGTNIKPSFWQ